MKANKKVIADAEVDIGFHKMIEIFDHIADKSEQTMPLLSSAMRHSIQVVKLYREAFNRVKNK